MPLALSFQGLQIALFIVETIPSRRNLYLQLAKLQRSIFFYSDLDQHAAESATGYVTILMPNINCLVALAFVTLRQP